MAWLFLDSHERGSSRLGWLGGPRVTSNEYRKLRTIPGSAGQLLNELAKDRKRLFSAEGVCVVAGPGSFSSVRTGVLYANLLSRLLRIPLVGVTVDEAGDLDALSLKLQATKLPANKALQYVAPTYDAEPNITVPRP